MKKRQFPAFWRILKHFWPEIRKHFSLILGSFFIFFAEIFLRLLEPWPLKFVFDRVIPLTPAEGYSGIPRIDAMEPVTLLVFASIAVVVFSGLRAVTAYSSTVGFALLGNRVLTAIRINLYRHIQCLSLSFHNKSRNGDLLIRVMSDVGLLQDVVVTAMLPLFGNILVLLGMVGIMFWLNWQLALIALAVFPLFWISTVCLGKKIQEVSRKQRKRESAMAATASESIGAIKTVQALSLEKEFSKAFSHESRKSLKEGVKAKRLAAGLERTVDMLIAIATALILWFGARYVLSKELTPGDLIVFLAYLKNAFKPLRNFAKYTGRLAKATASGERILQLMELTPEIRDLPHAIKAPPFQGYVRFENVFFHYDSGFTILKEINFEAKPGQHISIVGPSGAGKSTLVGLILRFYDPSRGRILIDDHDIRLYTVESLRSQISVVLQDTLLFAASVRENIAYGIENATQEMIEASAKLANAHTFISSLPEGYNTVLGERGVTLSLGQRQRIAIARSAIRQSPLLILDEPTTGLDKENEQEITHALNNLSIGRTTFLITHDLYRAKHSDVIFYLEDGMVCEYGTHAELMQAKGTYASVYQLQETYANSTRNRGGLHASCA